MLKFTIVIDVSQQLRALLCSVVGALKPCPDFRSKHLTVACVDFGAGLIIRGEITAMQCTDTQKFNFKFGRPLDSKNVPTDVEAGSVKFTVADGVSGHVGPSTEPGEEANPLAGQFIADVPNLDADGHTQATTIRIEADADLGEGVSPISGDLEVLVTASAAKSFGAPTVGTVEEQ